MGLGMLPLSSSATEMFAFSALNQKMTSTQRLRRSDSWTHAIRMCQFGGRDSQKSELLSNGDGDEGETEQDVDLYDRPLASERFDAEALDQLYLTDDDIGEF